MSTSEHRRQYMRKWWKDNKDRQAEYNRKFIERTATQFFEGTKQRASDKVCSLCKERKVADLFYLSNTNKDGLHGWCKDCSDRRTTENGRKRSLGVSPAEYQRMLDTQESRCAICSSDEKAAGKKSFCVDHDHKTGKVRGLLCTRCNTMLGNALDSEDILTSAIAYLRESK